MTMRRTMRNRGAPATKMRSRVLVAAGCGFGGVKER